MTGPGANEVGHGLRQERLLLDAQTRFPHDYAGAGTDELLRGVRVAMMSS